MKLAPVFDRLLAGWSEQGYRLASVADINRSIDRKSLPRCEVLQGTVSGRSGTLLLQGREFLAARH